jgi:hypothetical protein
MTGMRIPAMSPADLRELGSALYGPRWAAPLAAALGVRASTVRRWASGAWKVPVKRDQEIRMAAFDRVEAIMRRLDPPEAGEPD